MRQQKGISEGGCEDGDYDVGNRLGQEFVSSSRRRRARPDSGAAPAPPRAAADIYGAAATVPGGDGGVWQRPLLGSRDCPARSSGQVDESAVCAAVRKVQQERCAGRRGDL